MSKTLQIQIVEEEEEVKTHNVDFINELKDTLSELDLLPINQVRQLVKSEDFREDRERIQANFWKEFKVISKEDCSLDCAILLQYYGFTLHRKPYDDKITPIEEIELEELQELTIQ